MIRQLFASLSSLGACSTTPWHAASARCRKAVVYGLIFLSCTAVASQPTSASADTGNEDRFSGFEIRVIRPKFFTKTFRFEVGVQVWAILNNPFIYTFMGAGNVAFHFNEALAAEVSGAWGQSINKQEKTTLKKDFQINTIIHRTQHIVIGSLLWTPFYGKFQTSSERLIYYDFFLIGSGGITGINYQYDHCTKREDQVDISPQLKSYPAWSVGLGQKIFISKTTALRWDGRYTPYYATEGDGSCFNRSGQSQESSARKMKENIVVSFGISRFF